MTLLLEQATCLSCDLTCYASAHTFRASLESLAKGLHDPIRQIVGAFHGGHLLVRHFALVEDAQRALDAHRARRPERLRNFRQISPRLPPDPQRVHKLHVRVCGELDAFLVDVHVGESAFAPAVRRKTGYVGISYLLAVKDGLAGHHALPGLGAGGIIGGAKVDTMLRWLLLEHARERDPSGV